MDKFLSGMVKVICNNQLHAHKRNAGSGSRSFDKFKLLLVTPLSRTDYVEAKFHKAGTLRNVAQSRTAIKSVVMSERALPYKQEGQERHPFYFSRFPQWLKRRAGWHCRSMFKVVALYQLASGVWFAARGNKNEGNSVEP